jgi:DNA-binding XRE family transcriptional regulator
MQNAEIPVTLKLRSRFRGKYRKHKETMCWEWIGYIHNKTGYGKITLDGRSYLSHRVGYTIHKGPIPDGFVVDHLCRNRKCCNPEHLEAIPGRENVLRGLSAPSEQSGDRRRVLHAAQVRELKKARRDGMTQEECASKWGVSLAAVAHIDDGSCWSHVKIDYDEDE